MKSNESEMERLRKKVEQLEKANKELLQNRLNLICMLGDVQKQLTEEYSQAKIAQAKYSPIIRKNNENKRYIKISGKTALADEIRLMETLSPKLFLQEKQDGAPPVTADLNLLNYLNEIMQLNKETINALISYSLKMCNNRLIKSYVEKVAATLKRAKVNTALDAINYLNEKNDKPRKVTSKVKETKKETVKDDDSFDEEEYNKLLESIDKDNK